MNKDEELKVGDIVALKSNGPDMTVCKIEEDRVFCNWFSFGLISEIKYCTLEKSALRIIKRKDLVLDEHNFKAGDIVSLKSNGPDMTINRIKGDVAYCAWFPTVDRLETACIQVGALKVVKK